ncbi:coiled-coil domain-containing protein 201 [Vipera latastei]
MIKENKGLPSLVAVLAGAAECLGSTACLLGNSNRKAAAAAAAVGTAYLTQAAFYTPSSGIRGSPVSSESSSKWKSVSSSSTTRSSFNRPLHCQASPWKSVEALRLAFPVVSSSFEDNPDGWSSQYLKTICYGEPSNSSQIVFPRRFSTIIGSEESTEAFQKTSPFPMLPRKRSSNCSDAQSNEGLAGTTKTKSGQEATIFKESVTKNKIKKIYKKRVCGKCFSPMLFFKNKFKGFYESYRDTEEGVRQWELHQLKNIEEATIHELTIEYI